MVGETGLEPVWLAPRHFKCLVYPNSTTRPSSYPLADLGSQLPTVVCLRTIQCERFGGGGRNRTGVHGFAGRCMTTLPPRQRDLQTRKGKRNRNYPPSLEYWSGKRVSNSRPQPWQGCALPTELFPRFVKKIIVQASPPGNRCRRNCGAGHPEENCARDGSERHRGCYILRHA